MAYFPFRVKSKDTGDEFTPTQSMYDFAPDAYEVLEKKPGVDAGGNPFPPKLKTTVAKAAAKRAATTSTGNSATSEGGPVADTDKE